jgi:uncharacterized protein (TIRG00374 family)
VRRTLVWVGLLLSLVFGYLAFRDISLDALADSLASADYVFLLPAGLALSAGVVVRALRWRVLFERGRQPPFGLVLNALLISYLFNTILPARPGELVRIQLLGKRANISRAEVATTVVLERVYDLFVLIVLLGLAAPFLPAVGWLTAALTLGMLLGLALLASALLVWRFGRRGARFLLLPLRLLPRISERRIDSLAGSVVAGLAAVRGVRAAVEALSLSALSWLLLGLSGWFLLRGVDIHEGFAAALLVLVATNLVLVLPSSPASPAGVGAFEAAAVLALDAYGVQREAALSYALILHALHALPYIVVGYIALYFGTRTERSLSRTAT